MALNYFCNYGLMAHIVQMVPILNLMRLGCNSLNFNIVGFDCERDL